MEETVPKFIFVGVVLALALAGGNFTGASPRGEQSSSVSVTFVPETSAPAPLASVSPLEHTDALASESSSTSLSELATDTIALPPELKKLMEFVSSTPTVTQATPILGATEAAHGASRGMVSASDTTLPGVFHRVGNEDAPALGARIAFVADLATGHSYVNKNENSLWPIASITKLMTAVVALRSMRPTDAVMFSGSAMTAGDTVKVSPFKAGDSYSVKDATGAILLASSNEAAEAVANTYGRENFLAQMRAVAREWNLASLAFSDPTGLSPSNQSTAEDLRAMASRIWNEHPTIFNLTRKSGVTMKELGSGRTIPIASINLFAGTPGFLGGKTGFTDEAGGNLLSIFSYREHPLFVLVMGSDDRFGETEKLTRWFRANYQ